MNSVVFVTVDCLRPDHVGCYGYERDTTPDIDSLASRESAVTLEAYSNSPGTQWAMQSLYTGHWSNQIEGLGNPQSAPTLPGAFKEHGYATAGFSLNGHFSEYYDYNCDFDAFFGIEEFKSDSTSLTQLGKYINNAVGSQKLQQALSRIYNYYFLPAKSRVSDTAVGPSDADLVDRVVDWVEQQQANDQKFFTWVHLMNVHTPYPNNPKHRKAVDDDPDSKHIYNPNKSGDLDDPAYREDAFRAYDSAIRGSDEQIGRILDTVSDDTIVVVTADHGEDFGEWVDFHYPSAYSGMAQIPFVIDAPGQQASMSAPVSHIDFPPTLLKAVDIEPPAEWEGNPIQNNQHEDEDPIFFVIESPDYGCGVRQGKWKLVRETGREDALLYRNEFMKSEGEEIGDEYPDKREELNEILEAHLYDLRSRPIGDAKAGWETEEGRENLPDDVEDNLENLGYL